MTTYFITRHPGAIAWAQAQGISVDRQLGHLDINDIQPGDTVIGSLPVNLAAEVCVRGAAYFHLALTVPEEWRGQELSAEQMQDCRARLEGYEINKSTRLPSRLAGSHESI
jgi:CRISPR-associated protein Csx16